MGENNNYEHWIPQHGSSNSVLNSAGTRVIWAHCNKETREWEEGAEIYTEALPTPPAPRPKKSGLGQLSPTFLAPRTGFMEDNFSAKCGGWSGEDSSALQLLCVLFRLIITSAPPQTIRHEIPEVGDPWSRALTDSKEITSYMEHQKVTFCNDGKEETQSPRFLTARVGKGL